MSRPPENGDAGGRATGERRRRTIGEQEGQRALAFAVGAGLPIYLAFRGGGFDSVAYQQVGLAVWAAIALGFAFGLLPRAGLSRELRLPLAAIAALCVWTAASLAWTESDERTLAELGRLLLYAGVLTLAWTGLSGNTWRSAAAGLSVAALVVTVAALVSRLLPQLFPDAARAAELTEGRLSFPLDYWNALAGWAAAAGSVGLAWSVHAPRRELRAAALATVPVAGLVVYLSYSRGGLGLLALGGLAVIALSADRGVAARNALVSALATAVVVLVARTQPGIADATSGDGGIVVGLAVAAAAFVCHRVAGASRSGQSRGEATGRSATLVPVAVALGIAVIVALLTVGGIRGTDTGSPQDPVAGQRNPTVAVDPAARLVSLDTHRTDLWDAALGAFASDPLRGIGSGAFELWWAREGEGPGTPAVLDAHSLYLETLGELGLPGLALLLLFLVAALGAAVGARTAARRRREVGAATALLVTFVVFAAQASFDWVWEVSALALLGLGSVGVAGAASSRPLPRRRRLSAGRVAVVAVAIVACVAQAPGLIATDRVRASQASLTFGLTERAQRMADQAVRAAPWSASSYAQRASVELALGDLPEARTDAEEAISREPTYWRHRYLLAQIEASAGEDAAARAALDEVARLRPALAALITVLARDPSSIVPGGSSSGATLSPEAP